MVYSRILFLLTAITCSPSVSWGDGESNEEEMKNGVRTVSQPREQTMLGGMNENQLNQMLRIGNLNNNNLNQVLLTMQQQQVQVAFGNTQNSEIMPNSRRDPSSQQLITQEGHAQRMNTYQRMFHEQRLDTSMPAQYSFRGQEAEGGESLNFPQMESNQSNTSCSLSGCCTIF